MGPNARDLAAFGLFKIEAIYWTFNDHPIQPASEITAVAAVVLPISVMQRGPVLFQKIIEKFSKKYEMIRCDSDYDLNFCPYQQHN